jgi:hypothetical protein
MFIVLAYHPTRATNNDWPTGPSLASRQGSELLRLIKHPGDGNRQQAAPRLLRQLRNARINKWASEETKNVLTAADQTS